MTTNELIDKHNELARAAGLPELTEWKKAKAELEVRIAAMTHDPLDMDAPAPKARPSIVLPRHRLAVQVRGCFWHQHECGGGRLPKSNLNYWKPKLARNVERDAANDLALAALGWRVRIVWECELKGDQAVRAMAEAIASELD